MQYTEEKMTHCSVLVIENSRNTGLIFITDQIILNKKKDQDHITFHSKILQHY